MKPFVLYPMTVIIWLSLAHPCAAGNFQSDSKRFANPKMDIVVTEIERGARTSLLDIDVRKIGSSVGSSFFIVCSLRDLARQRGGFRYIVKREESSTGRMLVGFLSSADEPPESVDAQFAGAEVIDIERFTPICDTMK